MQLVIIHDELREGKFPSKKLLEMSKDISITETRMDEPFKKQITITVESDADPFVVAYTIGQFVGVYQGIRLS